MSRKPLKEWLILLTYLFLLILITVHSGYLCRKIWFVLRQCVPVIIAGILAFVLNQPYKYVHRFYEKKLGVSEKTARKGALLTVYLGTIGVVTAAGRFALPRFVLGLQAFVGHKDVYVQSFEKSAGQVLKRIGIRRVDLSPFMEGIGRYLGRVDQLMEEILPQMARMTTGAFRGLTLSGIIVVLSAYMLHDKDRLKVQIQRIYCAYIPERYDAKVMEFIKTVREVFENFIAGQSIEAIILGSLCFLGMFLLGLEYSGFVSLVVGLTAFIPFFGAYIGCAVGIILLLFISIKKSLIFLIFFVILQQIENNFIYPKVIGKRIGLPGLWVIASVTVGGGLFGLTGMILGVPSATLIYVLLSRSVRRREDMKKSGQDLDNRV